MYIFHRVSDRQAWAVVHAQTLSYQPPSHWQLFTMKLPFLLFKGFTLFFFLFH